MTFTHEQEKLYYDGVCIFSAPGKIRETLTTEFNQCIILYSAYDFIPGRNLPSVYVPIIKDPKLQEKVNQNILCFDKNGIEVWRVQASSEYPEDHVYIMKEQESDAFWSRRRDGEEFKIDKKTGKILDRRLGLR